MSTLDDIKALDYIKGLIIGDPGAGKTSALESLVAADYKLAIFDFDNLLTPLARIVRKRCPEKLKNVHAQTFTDRMKGPDIPLTMQGNSMKILPYTAGNATAYLRAMKQINHWKHGEEDLGPMEKLGKEWIVVVDSLTAMSMAAYRFCWSMNPGAKEPQAVYFAAQQMVENTLALLFADSFETNVLVLAHINYERKNKDDKDEVASISKGFPRSIGSALDTKIGAYFNTILQVEALSSTKRIIHTQSTGIVDLKNPVYFDVAKQLNANTGLAEYFRVALA